MKLNRILVFASLTLFFAVSCKKDNPVPIPNPQESYSVDYKLDVNGSYNDFQLSWFEPGSVLQQATSINSPWEVGWDNFREGYSVAFRLRFNTEPMEAISYQYSVTVNRDGSYIAGSSGSQSLTPGDTTFTIHVKWAREIGS